MLFAAEAGQNIHLVGREQAHGLAERPDHGLEVVDQVRHHGILASGLEDLHGLAHLLDLGLVLTAVFGGFAFGLQDVLLARRTGRGENIGPVLGLEIFDLALFGLDAGLDTGQIGLAGAGFLFHADGAALVFVSDFHTGFVFQRFGLVVLAANLDFTPALVALLGGIRLGGGFRGTSLGLCVGRLDAVEQADVKVAIFHAFQSVIVDIGDVHGGDLQADGFEIGFADADHVAHQLVLVPHDLFRRHGGDRVAQMTLDDGSGDMLQVIPVLVQGQNALNRVLQHITRGRDGEGHRRPHIQWNHAAGYGGAHFDRGRPRPQIQLEAPVDDRPDHRPATLVGAVALAALAGDHRHLIGADNLEVAYELDHQRDDDQGNQQKESQGQNNHYASPPSVDSRFSPAVGATKSRTPKPNTRSN